MKVAELGKVLADLLDGSGHLTITIVRFEVDADDDVSRGFREFREFRDFK